MNHLLPTYNRLSVAFEKGEGIWLWDSTGKRYMDALSGIAVCGLGHTHPKLVEALTDQAQRLWHCSNLFEIPLQQQLAEKLCMMAGMDQVFFANSGAEANESALKLAKRYGNSKGIAVPAIVVFEHAFHGRTMATLSATGNPKVHQGFEPLVEHFVRVPINDIAAIREVAQKYPNIVAVLLEPIQGEGGVNVLDLSYLQQLHALARSKNWLFMADEIQSGMGRTGTFCALEHAQIKPDVLTLAKGLGNGFPIGACLVSGVMRDGFQPGNHGTTFGGNPLACAVALKVLEVLEKEDLMSNAAERGAQLLSYFEAHLSKHLVSIRGKGLMIGLELKKPCADLVQKGLDAGIVLNVTAGNVVRLLPPLTITQEETQELAERVTNLIVEFCA